MALIDPRHGPSYDLSGGVGPTGRPAASLLLATTPRTGSTLLARLLWATGRGAAPREYVNPIALRDWAVRRGVGGAGLVGTRTAPVWAAAVQRDAGFRRAHLAAVWQARTDREGRFACKVHAHHARAWTELLDPGAAVVRLVREDRVAQAISWARARQTGRWAAHQQARGPDRPDPRAVDRRLAAIEADEAWWDTALAGRSVWTLQYEDVIADPAAAVRAVLTAWGVADADAVRVPPVWTTPQGDGRTAIWRDAWRASHGEGTDLHRRR